MLHNLGAAYGQRPSSFLEVKDSWAAYQLDLACLTLGRWVENKLEERDRRGRPIHKLEDLLEEGKPAPSKYAPMKHLAKKKMRVPKSGIW